MEILLVFQDSAVPEILKFRINLAERSISLLMSRCRQLEGGRGGGGLFFSPFYRKSVD